MKLTFNGFDKSLIVNIKNVDDKIQFNKSFKTSLTRRKYNWMDLAEPFLKETKRVCGFCGKSYFDGILLYEINNEEIFINGVEYIDELNFCRSTNCIGKGLNPNSIEFVSKSRGIDEILARELIHSRNSTPFYQINHPSNEEYKKSQNNLAGISDIERSRIINKANYSRSLKGMKEKYGNKEGERKYLEINSSKSLNEDYWKSKFGDDWVEQREEWLSSTVQTKENFIKRYGEEEGEIRYSHYIQKQRINAVKKAKIIGSPFGRIGRTDKGELLRSSLEIKFYELMKEFDLHKLNYEVEKYYISGEAFRSDFFFHDINLHIEIAGMMELNSYKEKMLYKKNRFGCIVVETEEEMVEICKHIKKVVNV